MKTGICWSVNTAPAIKATTGRPPVKMCIRDRGLASVVLLVRCKVNATWLILAGAGLGIVLHEFAL